MPFQIFASAGMDACSESETRANCTGPRQILQLECVACLCVQARDAWGQRALCAWKH